MLAQTILEGYSLFMTTFIRLRSQHSVHAKILALIFLPAAVITCSIAVRAQGGADYRADQRVRQQLKDAKANKPQASTTPLSENLSEIPDWSGKDEDVTEWQTVYFKVENQPPVELRFRRTDAARTPENVPLYKLSQNGDPIPSKAKVKIIKERASWSPARLFDDGYYETEEEVDSTTTMYLSESSHYHLKLSGDDAFVSQGEERIPARTTLGMGSIHATGAKMRVSPKVAMVADTHSNTDKVNSPSPPQTPPNTDAPRSQTTDSYAELHKQLVNGDMRGLFAPYMNAPELAAYIANLDGKDAAQMKDLNEKQIEKIVAEKRTVYPGMDKITADNVKDLQPWQLIRFCAEKRNSSTAAPSESKASDFTGGKTPMDDLKTAAKVQPSASSVATPPTLPDWINNACKDVPSTFPMSVAAAGSSSNLSAEVPPPGSPNGTPVPEENKWLKKDHLYAGAKGGMIGAIIGTTLIPFMGPWGIALGAAVGAATLYGISKVTE